MKDIDQHPNQFCVQQHASPPLRPHLTLSLPRSYNRSRRQTQHQLHAIHTKHRTPFPTFQAHQSARSGQQILKQQGSARHEMKCPKKSYKLSLPQSAFPLCSALSEGHSLFYSLWCLRPEAMRLTSFMCGLAMAIQRPQSTTPIAQKTPKKTNINP